MNSNKLIYKSYTTVRITHILKRGFFDGICKPLTKSFQLAEAYQNNAVANPGV